MLENTGVFVFAVLLGALVCGLLGMAVGSARGNGGMGMLLGILLGPLGILVAVLLPRKESERHASSNKTAKKLASYAARRGDPIDEWEAREQRKR